jgi:hypothetical protein
MRRTDGDSWNNKRLDFVTFAFQVSAHCFEYHAFVPSNESTHVFSDDPFGFDVSYNRKHVRPLVAVICRSFSSSGVAEGLAGETACNDTPVTIVVSPICFPSSIRLFVDGLCHACRSLWSLAFGVGSIIMLGVGNKVGDVAPELAVRPVLSEDTCGELLPLAENMSDWFIRKYLL